MTVYSGPFEDLPLFRYGLIMADPPWLYKNWSDRGQEKNATKHYRCSPIDELKKFRVADLAAPDCILWLWATNPMLRHAMELMDAWGFEYKTAGHWAKYNFETKKQAFGTGYVHRSAGEPWLIGTIGKPKATRVVRSVILSPRREHSRKPEKAFSEAERLLPGVRRIELFSRQERDGWDTWGDETSKFNEK